MAITAFTSNYGKECGCLFLRVISYANSKGERRDFSSNFGLWLCFYFVSVLLLFSKRREKQKKKQFKKKKKQFKKKKKKRDRRGREEEPLF